MICSPGVIGPVATSFFANKLYSGEAGSFGRGGTDGSTLSSKLILLGGYDNGGAAGKLNLGSDGGGPRPPSLLSLLPSLSTSSPLLYGSSFFLSLSNLYASKQYH